ncbi:hypothetical protein BDN72DRAFT_764773 [Pluteus cervinus]|uniref:Uncharacterized protein n=1 Tax=Pluteus cervinus TaxID=181527 RepID=A0ACD3B3L4_9AGAR|nr:hypothetical protein BDN72DRAFT_764773 [Pluteus cervinus]
MDSPWEESAEENTARDAEWTKISSEFTNAGYREGITAGKEGALQEGFDAGFAQVGAPIGHQLGFLRGLASGLNSYLKSAKPQGGADDNERLVAEIRQITSNLSDIRFSDIMPPDLEAEEHARQHLVQEGEAMDESEEIAEKKNVERIEDMFASLSAGANPDRLTRPTTQDLHRLSQQLKSICTRLNFNIETWEH